MSTRLVAANLADHKKRWSVFRSLFVTSIRRAGRAIPQACAKAFSNGIVFIRKSSGGQRPRSGNWSAARANRARPVRLRQRSGYSRPKAPPPTVQLSPRPQARPPPAAPAGPSQSFSTLVTGIRRRLVYSCGSIHAADGPMDGNAARREVAGQEKAVAPEQRHYYQRRHDRTGYLPHPDSIVHRSRIFATEFQTRFACSGFLWNRSSRDVSPRVRSPRRNPPSQARLWGVLVFEVRMIERARSLA